MVNLDRLDRIVVNIDQMENISSWVEKQGFNDINIPMNEILVIFEGIDFMGKGMTMGLYFKMDDKKDEIIIEQYDMSDHFVLMSAKIDNDFFINETIKVESKYDKYFTGEYVQSLAKRSILMVFDIFQYIVNREELVIPKKVTVTRNNKRTARTSSKAKYRRKGYSSKRLIKYNVIRYDIEDKLDNESVDKREYIKTAHSWSVRGHWRYYKKTGKRVWIDRYIKGDKSKGFNEKVYEIEKETT